MNPESQQAANVSKPAELKLDYKKTTLIGLAFLAIQMFWQVYDSYMPLFLEDFNLSATKIGVIMALDNIMALVLLPFIGFFSDNFPKKLRNKYGRRIPFIVIGSVLAALIFIVVNIAHINRNLSLMISMTVLLLFFMNLYRTPAVSLMPDITPKRVRSSANAIINIMGALGMAVALVISFLTMKTVDVKNEAGEQVLNRYNMPTKMLDPSEKNWVIIGLVCAVLILVAVIFVFLVKENKFVKEKNEKLKSLGLDIEETTHLTEKISLKEVANSLEKRQKISLLFILISVALWYIAYNAIGTWFSIYWFNVLARKDWQTPILIGNLAAFAMFVPATKLGKKIGRKNTVLVGVGMMIAAFAMGTILQFSAPPSVMVYTMYVVFAIVGAGWATINVHSFVMSIELANDRTNGVFTGLYYAFAMGAQALTPILSGAIIQVFGDVPNGLIVLLPYAFIFSYLAFLTMMPVKHGNAKDKPIDDYNHKL